MAASAEFQINGTNYLLSSDCERRHWVVLQKRVQAWLLSGGKIHVLGEAKNKFYHKVAGTLVHFTLTINPQGNTFQ